MPNFQATQIGKGVTLQTPTADGSANQVIETDGSGNLSFVDQSGGGTPRGYIDGLEISNNGTDSDHDIDFGTGIARDSDDGTDLELTSSLTKQIDASFAAGDAAGGLFSGTVAADTWYHCFVMKKDSDGTIDAGFDTSVSAANIPAGYTEYRRVGSVLTDGSSNIIAFLQNGDDFIWDEMQDTTDTTDPGSSAVLETLSVPPDLKVRVRLVGVLQDVSGDAQGNRILFTDPDRSDTDPLTNNKQRQIEFNPSTDQRQTVVTDTWSNTSSQIRYRLNVSDGDVQVKLSTVGWTDPRGKDA